MKFFRENPDSEENERLTRDNERAVFAAQLQAKQPPELRLINSLLARCITFDEEDGQSAAWKYQVARDLNWIVSRAEYVLTTTGDNSDIAFADAALRIVERIASDYSIEPIKAAHIDIGDGPNP